MKKLFRYIILYFTRKQMGTENFYNRMRKIQIYSLCSFIFLLLVIGLNWTFSFKGNDISISAKLNPKIWWSLIMLINSVNFTFMYFFSYYMKFRRQYKDNLLKEDYVMVGFKDDMLVFNKMYIVLDYNNLNFSRNGDNYFLGNMLIDGDLTTKIIEGDRIFKFISPKQNRKLKLERLRRI